MTLAAQAFAQEDAPAVSEKPRPAMMAPLAARSTLLGIALAGPTLVAVGDRGHILRSDDGKAWSQVAAPADAMLNRVRFRDEKNGFAVGHDAAIMATKDGGATWTAAHFDSNARPLYDILFIDAQRHFALGGYGTVLESTDAGATWASRDFPIAALGQHFNAGTTLGDGSLLVAGEKGLLMRSKDQGENWELLDSPYTGSFFGVLPHGPAGAIAFGLRGNVYVSDDVSKAPTLAVDSYDPYTRETVSDAARLAKLGWKRIPSPTTESFLGGIADGAGAVLVGVNGVVVRVEPAAGTAAAVRSPDGKTLNDLVRKDGRWIAAGRLGARDLGDLK